MRKQLFEQLEPRQLLSIAPSADAVSAGQPAAILPTSIVGRYLFYNHSSFDGNDVAANAADDGAIAFDKTPLFLSTPATFTNYTSYSRGVNGLIIDVANAPGELTLNDFSFRVGNLSDRGSWTVAPTPSGISMRIGAGAQGSNRISITWPDGAIQKQWLEVILKPTVATGLSQPDVFYFGNAVGEIGNPDARVDARNEIAARNHPRTFLDRAGVDYPYDFDRDGYVNATDQILARANPTTLSTALKLINVHDTQSPTLNIHTIPVSLTNHNLTITGSVADDLSGVVLLSSKVDGANFEIVDFDVDGSFSFTTNLPLDGSADGPHTLQLQAIDAAGNLSASYDLSFELLTIAPVTPAFELSAGSVSPQAANPSTTAYAQVTLVGATSPNVTVKLIETGATTLSSNTGFFQFPGVHVGEGSNLFTVEATDLAGNSASFQRVIERVSIVGQQDPVLRWVQTAIEAIQLDATAPPAATRALAMMSAAVYDAVNSIEGKPGYYLSVAAPADASVQAAVSGAAHELLTYLFPAQQSVFDAVLSSALQLVVDGPSETAGMSVGRQVGEAIIAMRAGDGWDTFVDHVPGNQPGQWQETAPMYAPALLPQWAALSPFAMTRGDQFRPTGPPDLSSPAWADAYNEVKTYGSSTSAVRTADQTQIARYWADGGGTYTPPGHWNQIAAQLAAQQGLSLDDTARLFAILNIGLGDAAIVAWDAKYVDNFWRPITAVAQAAADGNPQTAAAADWVPLLPTPPFPEYVSGHSTFSGTAAGILNAILGNQLAFSSTSAFLKDAGGNPVTRSFTNFDQAAAEAGQSRIYGGIHFQFSNQDGLAAGYALANYVVGTFALSSDAQPPKIIVTSIPGTVTTTNITLSGRVLDNLTGVALLESQIDDGAFVPVNFDALTGAFAIATGLSLDGSADGPHVMRLRATDNATNQSALVEHIFTLDTLSPTIDLMAPIAGETLAAAARLIGWADGTGSAIVDLRYSWDSGPSRPLPFDVANGEINAPLDLSTLSAGSHTLSLMARDAAGKLGAASVTISLDARIPLTVADFPPQDGAGEIGVTFRPRVVFSRPIDVATLTDDTLFATDVTGATIATTVVPAADGTYAWLLFDEALPGSSRITVHLDGEGIRDLAGDRLDGDGDGIAGGQFQSSFTTVSLTSLPGTSLAGIVADPGPDLKPGTVDDLRAGPDGVLMTGDDIYLLPIAGVKVYLLGLDNQYVFTDAQGRFSFSSVPSGNVKLAVDGRTAPAPPSGLFFPEMVMDLRLEPGVANTVMRAMETDPIQAATMSMVGVFLPRLRDSMLQPTSDTQPTTVDAPAQAAPNLTDEQRQLLSLTVPPGAAIGPSGEIVSQPQIGISTVPAELVREMLPPGLMQHTFDVTIQAPGVSVFTTPIAFSAPNLFGAAPGTQLNFLSFDHTTGRLVIEGTGTVSADGSTVTTDPGQGITHPGWHGWVPPTSSSSGPGGGGPGPAPPNPCENGTDDPFVVPRSDGVHNQLFVGDEGKIKWSFGNLTGNSDNQGACPLPPGSLKITFKYDDQSIADEFLDGLPKSMVLGPNEEKTVEIDVKDFLAKTTIADKDVEYVKNRLITSDTLFGATVTIEYRNGKGRLLGEDKVSLYRLVETADDRLSDGIIEMPDTATGTTHKRPIDLKLGGDTRASFEPVSDGAFDDPASFPSSDADFQFSPTGVREDIGAGLKLFNAYGIEVPIEGGFFHNLLILGDGKHQKVFIDYARFDRALDGLRTTDALGSTLQAEMADPAKRQQLMTAAVGRFSSLLQPFAAGIEMVSGNGSDVVAFDKWSSGEWVAAPQNGVYAEADRVDDHISDSKTDDPATVLKLRFTIGDAQAAFRMSQLINQNAGGFVDVFLSTFRQKYAESEEKLPAYQTSAELAKTIGDAMAHEYVHTLGLQHPRDAVALELMNAAYGYEDRSLPVNFVVTPPVIKIALGLPWDPDDGSKSLDYYAKSIIGPHLTSFTGQEAGASYTTYGGPLLHVFDAADGRFVSALDFGVVSVDGPGGALAGRQIVLNNLGEVPLVIDGARLSADSGFAVETLPAGTTIAPYSSLPITVTFDPLKSRAASAQLIVSSNSLAGEVRVDLSGFGLSPNADLQLSVANNNVGGQDIDAGARLVAGWGTIKNVGASPLSITDIRLAGGPGPFAVTNLPAGFGPGQPLVLQPGQSFTLDVSFDAQAAGLARATLEIVSNDPASPTTRKTIVGTGTLNVDDALALGHDYMALELLFQDPPQVFRQRTDNNGHWEFQIPPQRALHHITFDPISGLIGESWDVSGLSGSEKVDRRPAYGASTAPDSDGDGLPDDIEFSIGSAAGRTDTDQDGLDDFEEVASGGDPLGGRPAALGLVAGSVLPGLAQSVVVLPSPDLRSSLAYVATAPGNSAGGLFVVDVTNAAQPRSIGGALLAGVVSDVAVNGLLQMAIVPAGSAGVHLIDVSDPLLPIRRVSLTFGADVSRAETYATRAYLTAGANLVSIDLETRTVLETFAVGGAKLTDIVRAGSTLYTIDEQNVVRSFDVGTSSIVAGGAVPLLATSTGGRLFAGDNVLYVAIRNIEFAQGFATIDIVNRTQPQLISSPDNTAAGFANTDLAYNGSGRLLAVGNQVGQAPSLDLLNLSDPQVTDNLVTRFEIPQTPRGVAMGDGFALVASAASGLQVANIAQLDTFGIAPTVSIASAAADVSATRPDTQLRAGEHLLIDASVIEDIQTKRAELLLDGQVVARDLAFPFEFEIFTPNVSAPTPITLQVRAIDTAGNSGLSNLLEFELLPASPHVMTTTPLPGSTTTGDVDGISLTFDKPIVGGELLPTDFTLVGDGADNLFGTADDVVVAVDTLSLDPAGKVLGVQLAAPLESDTYRLTVPAHKLKDVVGNLLDGEYSGAFPTGDDTAGGDFVFSFVVDRPPQGIDPAAFPQPRYRMVQLTDNEQLDDRFNSIGGGALDTRGNGNVLSVDVNNDGRLDLVRPSFGIIYTKTAGAPQTRTFDAVGVRLQRADGSFAEPVNYPVGAHPRSVEAGDFNGDGVIDLLTVNVNSAPNGAVQPVGFDLSILIGNGQGGFAAEIRQATGRTVASNLFEFPQVAVGRFNAGSALDVAVLMTNAAPVQDFIFFNMQTEVLIFAGNGDGTFVTPAGGQALSAKAFSRRRELFVADINSDGHDDLVTPEQILTNNGAGSFTPSLVPGEEGTRIVAVADVAGNPTADVLTEYGNGFVATLALLVNNGSGGFTTTTSAFDQGDLATGGGALTDVDGDGLADWIVPNRSSGISVHRGNANLTFQHFARLPISAISNTARSFVNVAVADLGGDGPRELISTRQGDEAVVVMLGQADGTLDLPSDTLPRTGGPGTFPKLAGTRRLVDMTGDGILDLVGSGQGLLVIPGIGNGTFGTAVASPERAVYSVGLVDAGAIPDVVGSDTVGNVVLQRGLGNGGFAAATAVASLGLNSFSDPALAIEVLDATGDGNRDIAVMHTLGVTIIPGNGNGTFGVPINTPTAAPILRRTLLAFDANGDGRQDLLVPFSNGVTDSLHVLLSNANGALVDAGGLPPSVGRSSRFVAGDLDGDGDQDLVVVTADNSVGYVGELLVFRGNGDGTFATASRLAIDDYTDVRLADLNGDSRLDIIAAGLHEVSCYAGLGNGSFALPTRFDVSGPTASFPTDILVGDVTSDGRPDIIDYVLLLVQNPPPTPLVTPFASLVANESPGADRSANDGFADDFLGLDWCIPLPRTADRQATLESSPSVALPASRGTHLASPKQEWNLALAAEEDWVMDRLLARADDAESLLDAAFAELTFDHVSDGTPADMSERI